LFILWFLVYNLLTTNARKPVKGSKDADFRRVFFKRSTKLPLAVEAQGLIKWAKRLKSILIMA